MMILHSSGGLAPPDWQDAAALNRVGIATAVVDSFTPRGLVDVWKKKQVFTAWQLAEDGATVLAWLARHQRIDTQRLAAMGRSLGGEATIYLSLEKARQYSQKRAVAPDLALAVAIYPGCIGQWRDAKLSSSTRLQFFLAADDDITPAAHCSDYASRMRRAGSSVDVFTFAQAYHSFDVYHRAVYSSQQENYAACRNEWRGPKDHVRLDTGAQIAGPERLGRYLSSCKTLGGWVGGNPKAAVDMRRRLLELAALRLMRRQ